MDDKHTFLKHVKHLKEVGLRYDDDLTRLQQKQRQDLSADFNTLKSTGHKPIYRGSSLKFRHADKTRTCERDGANRVQMFRFKFSVLQLLREHELYAHLAKCQCVQPELHFLGHIVGAQGLHANLQKVAIVQHWPMPKDKKSLQKFWGLANHFRKCIRLPQHLTTCLSCAVAKPIGCPPDVRKMHLLWYKLCRMKLRRAGGLVCQ